MNIKSSVISLYTPYLDSLTNTPDAVELFGIVTEIARFSPLWNFDEERYLTYNKLSDGNHKERYYEDKYKNYPPDIDRNPDKNYKFKV